MKSIICFIDDSGFEHDLVRNEIGPMGSDMEFVQAYTFEEASESLGERWPALFLLDLWGRDEDVKNPSLFSREELEEKIAAFPQLDHIFTGLDHYKGDRINEYLKRFFSIVDSWRNLFEEVCARAGQNRNYGLANLRKARNNYPGVPAVFYTRKSLISDAVAMFDAGSNGLFIKPTGSDDAETRRLTREYAPQLLSRLREIIKAQ